jgi:hypothetical protein
MTKKERAQVVELLELAHGYAILRSAMPFRSACVELGHHGDDVSKAAGSLIDKARDEMRLDAKPKAPDYEKAIGLALDRVEQGEWP